MPRAERRNSVAREDDEGRNRDENLRRQVSRTIANWLAAISSIGLIAGWASTGVYQLEPGEKSAAPHDIATGYAFYSTFLPTAHVYSNSSKGARETFILPLTPTLNSCLYPG